MKNIAIMVPLLVSGGSERIASRLTFALQGKYNVFLILFDDEDISYEYGGKLINMKLPSRKSKIGKVINMRKRIKALKKIIHDNKIDYVFSFTSAADYVNAFSKAKCKRLVSCRGSTFLENNLERYHSMCKCSDGILFNSKEMRNFYIKHYPDDKEKAFVLYNLFDIDKIIRMSKESVDSEYEEFFKTHKTITTVSRFVEDKGQWHLIKAFEILKKKVPDAGLVFVGHQGAVEKDIIEMAEKSKYSKDIKFVGYTDNPFKYMSKSHVYALCSLGEGFPNALVEAMACGLPVVSTNCKTGPSEILFEEYKADICDDNYSIADFGIITPRLEKEVNFDHSVITEKEKIYAAALERMIMDNELSADFKEKGIKKAWRYDNNAIMKEYIELIEKI